MNIYNLDSTVIKPIENVSLPKSVKLTKKQISTQAIKIIMRDIYDIPEIQYLPEHNYDYFKMYSMKYMTVFLYAIERKMSIHDYVMKRFSGSILFNEYIYKLYYNFYKTSFENINVQMDELKDKLLNINYIIKNNSNFILQTENMLTHNLIRKYNNPLIITNSIDKMKYFIVYKNDIISIKQFANTTKRIDEIKNISNTILISNSFKEFQNIIESLNNKYDCIFIEINYINFDYILGNINLICKIQTIIFTILNGLLKLNNNGRLIVNLRHGYIKTPLFKKILTLLCRLFESNDFIGLDDIERIYFIFDNFKGFNNKITLDLIKNIINIVKTYETREINQDHIFGLLSSNKFNYKINSDFIKYDKNKLFKKNDILYDINGLDIDYKLIENIIIKYDNYYKKQILINNYIKLFYNNKEEITDLIKRKYIYFFQNIKKYNIINIENIDYLIKIFRK
jgi:hypothetical protein